ncbi:MAG: hypothetical protein VXV85_00590 [Candidatus Thermoplasmatota archaeon]|nr:hypothetical protein [Candidatus Thermoplasmatota archaeon]
MMRGGGIGIGSYVLRDTQLVKLAWMVPLCSVIAAVGIHVALGNVRDVPFFISEADYPGFERFVFTTGLFVSAVLHFILTLRLYTLFKDIARRKILRTATILGVASSTHLAVLAFANMYDHLALHVYTSLVVFHGGFTWAILAHFSLPHPNRTGRTLRLVSLFIAFVSLTTMTIAMSRGIEQQRRAYNIQPEMIPLNDLQPWIDVAAPAEFILFFSLLGCLASFSWDIVNHADQTKDSTIEA